MGREGDSLILSGQSCLIPKSVSEEKHTSQDLRPIFLVPTHHIIVFSNLNKCVVLRIIRQPLSSPCAQVPACHFLSKQDFSFPWLWFELPWEWGLCLKRSITVAFPFQHVNGGRPQLFLVRSMMGRLFYRRYTEVPIFGMHCHPQILVFKSGA